MVFQFPYSPYGIQLSFMKSLYDIAENGMFGILESPTGTGKSMSIICGICKWLMDQRSVNTDISRIPKVIYATRTHSQIEQFMKEFQKSPYNGCLNMCLAGSRSSLCVNPEVNTIESRVAMNWECIRRSCVRAGNKAYTQGCSFNVETDMTIFNLSASQLKTEAQKNLFCPYYACRNKIRDADIQVVPYNYVFSQPHAAILGGSLNNSVIILDEAHNFLPFIDSLNRCKILVSSITDSLEFLEFYGQYSSCISDVAVLDLCSCLKDLLEYIKSSEGEVKLYTGEFGVRFLHNISLNLKLYEINEQVMKSLKSVVVPGNIWKHFSCGFLHVCEMLSCISRISSNNVVHISASRNQSLLKREISVIPVERSDVLYPLLNSVRSLVLTGATIEPLKELLDVLESCEIPKSRVKIESYEHVVKASQILSIAIPRGINGGTFDFRFGERHNESMVLELGLTLTKLFEFMPCGSVVFFTSFKFLNYVVETWNRSGILELMRRSKEVFVDSGLKSRSIAHDYINHVNNGNSAALLSVLAGRWSEGINFSDDLLRSVFIVGMPYKNPFDPFTSSLRQNIVDTKGESYYKHIYKGECMKLVNQAIGRSIRHSNDYSTILLFDHRYTSFETLTYLPKWIQKSTMKYDSYDEMMYQIQTFYKMNEEELIKKNNAGFPGEKQL